MIPFQHGVFATSSAAASGFEAIATVTLSGNASSITFNSIPNTYASLQIRAIVRNSTSGGAEMVTQFNGSTSTIYTRHYLGASGGGSVYSYGYADTDSASAAVLIPGSDNLTSVYSAMILDIHDYASTTRYKTIRSFNGYDSNTTGSNLASVYLQSGLWRNTAQITSVTFTNSPYMVAGTTFALYGIKAAA